MTDPNDDTTVRTDFFPKLARNLAHVPFAHEAVAAWYAAFDPQTPVRVKATLVGALAYFILPFDVIPDVFLGLGFTDDLAVLVTAISMVRGHVTQAHRDKALEKVAELRNT